MAAIYIDGVLTADNVDCYSTTRGVNMLFSKIDLTNATHTIKVVVKGTKNPASKGIALVHDYFDFPVVSPTIIDDASVSNTYTGDWRIVTSEDGYYNRTCHVGTSVNSGVEATFTGTQISWYALKNNDLGMAAVYIDGVLAQDDIDCYSTARGVYLLFNKSGLSNGSHTIKVVLKGTKNVASSGIALVHDYFSVLEPVSAAIALSGNLTFGDVAQNSISTKNLTISNTSNVPLSVSSIDLPVGFSADWTSGDIAVDAQQQVIITFAPTAVKTYSGMIKVNNNVGIDSIAVSGTVTSATAINEIHGIKMNLSPNPVQNCLTIVTEDLCNIEISDISGKVLIRKELKGTTSIIDMSEYPSGIFILKATDATGVSLIQKVVKK